MRIIRFIAALLAAGTAPAFSAPAPYIMLDHSSPSLMEPATAQAMWKDQSPSGLQKLYPPSKWGFVTQVEGGFTDAKVCVVTARIMMLPRSVTALTFRPAKTATTFGAQTDASPQQCREFAKTKLAEAIDALRSSMTAR